MPPRKKKVNANSLANLRNQKPAKPVEPNQKETDSDEEVDEIRSINMRLDSTRPEWGEESGEEEEEVEEIEDPKAWDGEKLKKAGIYAAVVDAALRGVKSAFLGDVCDDSADEDYMPAKQKRDAERNKRNKRDRPLTYVTVPDISMQSERTQRRYKKSWATQTSLDGYIGQSKKNKLDSEHTAPIIVDSSDESISEGVEEAGNAIESEDSPPTRRRSVEIEEIEDEDAPRPPSTAPGTPEPILIEIDSPDSRDNNEESDTIQPSRRRSKRRRNSSPGSESEGRESSTVPPAVSGPTPTTISDDVAYEQGIDPDTGIACWEEEMADMLAPKPEDIRSWDVLRDKINAEMKAKFKSLTQTQINQYIILRSFSTLLLRGYGWLEASRQVALQWQHDVRGSASHFSRRIRALSRHYQIWERLPQEKRGGYRSKRSVMKDEEVQLAARVWLNTQKIGTVTPKKFCEALNSEILPGKNITLNRPLSTKTATRWLVKLGWVKTRLKKGVYMDGHEREDVVRYRKTHYLPKMAEYQRRMAFYEGPELRRVEPSLGEGEKELIPLFQDESCCHANEFQTNAWLKPGQQILQKKGRGRLIMISEFIESENGRLVVRDESGEVVREARRIIYPGSNGDPYWDKKQLLDQIKNAAIPVFEEAHPGKQALFIFDQSSAHAALPDDALKAFEMNKKDGGAQRIQRDTIIPMNNPAVEFRGLPQPMTTLGPDGKPIAKGLATVLKERGFNVDGMKAKCKPVCPLENTDCCLARLLSKQDDFVNQVSELETIITDAGHLCIFLPKFHCELNPIEMYWGWVKYRYRERSKSNFEEAKQAARECLDVCPNDVIRRFINRSWRFTEAYRRGLTGKAAEWAVRKYKGHRTIGNRSLMLLESIVTA